jgi:hypothetical protein
LLSFFFIILMAPRDIFVNPFLCKSQNPSQASLGQPQLFPESPPWDLGVPKLNSCPLITSSEALSSRSLAARSLGSMRESSGPLYSTGIKRKVFIIGQ